MLQFVREKKTVFPFEDMAPISGDRISLVASAHKFGLVFVGHKTIFKAYETSAALNENTDGSLTTINTGYEITHISTSCDGLTLLVVAIIQDCPHSLFYDVRSFNQKGVNVIPFFNTPLSTSIGARIMAISWNPTDPACTAIATSVGDITILTLKENAIDINSKKGVNASALGWSAKGKQLTAGCKDGSLALYKPDLTLVRAVKPPPTTNPGVVLDLVWFSNTEFFLVYLLEEGPCLMYVNAPKNAAARYVNFCDVCYSNDCEADPNYYMTFCAEWNLLFVFSSLGIEMAVLGRSSDPKDSLPWCQWSPDDSSRAEMNMINVTQETFPMGMTIDFTSSKRFQNKAEKIEGPFPVIYSLSTGGELNMFHVNLQDPGTKSLVVPTEKIPTSGVRTNQQYNSFPPPMPVPQAPLASMPAPINVSSTPAPAYSLSSVPAAPFSLNTTPASAYSTNNAPAPAYSSSNAPAAPAFSLNTAPVLTSSSQMPDTVNKLTTASTASSSFFSGAQSSFSFGGASTFGNNLLKSETSVSSALFTPTTPAVNNASLSLNQNQPNSSSASSFTFSLPSSTTLFSSTPKVITSTIATTEGSPAKPIASKPIAAMSLFTSTPKVAPSTVVVTQAVSTKPVLSSTLLTQPKGLPNKSAEVKKMVMPKLTTEMNANLHAKFVNKIQDEINQFEVELRKHFNENQNSFKIGTTEESKAICGKLSISEKWIVEMQKTMDEQNNEVSLLHKGILECFSIIEEGNLVSEKKTNPRLLNTLEARKLDPYAQSKLNDIRSKYQYLIAQLQCANEKLECDWLAFSENKKKKNKLQSSVVTGENFYRSILNVSNVRQSYDKELDKTVHRLRKVNLKMLTPLISTNMNDLLSSSKKPVTADVDEIENILNKTTLSSQTKNSPVMKISSAKKTKLKHVLLQRNHTPLRTSSSSKSFIRTPVPLCTEFSPQKSLGVSIKEENSKAVGGEVANSNYLQYEDISPSESPVKSFNAVELAMSVDRPSFLPLQSVGSKMAVATKLNFDNMESDNKTDFNFSLPKYSICKPASNVALPPKSASISFSPKAGQIQTPNSVTITPIAATSAAPNTLSSLLTKDCDNSSQSASPSVSVVPGGFFNIKPSGNMFGKVSFETKTDVSSSITQARPFSFTPMSSNVLGNSQETSKISIASDRISTPVQSKTPPLFASISTNKDTLDTKSAFSFTTTSNTLFSVNNSSVITITTSSSFITTTTPSILSVSNSAFETPGSSTISKSKLDGTANLSLSNTGNASSNSLFGNINLPSSNSSGSLFTSSSTLFSNVEKPTASKQFSGSTLSAKSSIMPTDGLSIHPASTSSVTSITSVFGTSNAADTTTTKTSIANTSSTAFSSFAGSSSATTTASIFGTSSSSTTAGAFGTPTVTLTTKSNILGIPSSANSFTSQTTTSTSTTVASVFSASSTTTSEDGVFGVPSVTASSAGIFGAPTVTTTAAGLFNVPSVTTTSAGIFSEQTATTTAAGIFGAPSASTTSAGIFGGPSSPTTSASIFGGSATTTTTTSTFGVQSAITTPASPFSTQNSNNMFGAPTNTTTSSVFATPATSSSIFGGQSTTPATSSSIFGVQSTTNTSSVFGGAPTSSNMFGASSASNTQSVFGGATTSLNTFGTPSSSASPFQNSSSMFKAPATAEKQSFFGGANTSSTTSSSSNSVFGGSSAFGANVATTTTSTFGTASVFGQATPASSPFGDTNSESLFGQNTSGGMFSGLGGKPSDENAKKNVFGTPVTEAKPQLSLFGGNSSGGGGSFGGSNTNATSGLFGGSSGTSVFGGGGNTTATTQSGFGGAFPSPTPAVFGGSATFGGSPSFGGAPTLGQGTSPFGKSSFGQSPSFGGSPGFGASAPTNASGGFSAFASGGGGATFGGLSSGFSQTPSSEASFGNAAPQNPSFSATSSFSSWR